MGHIIKLHENFIDEISMDYIPIISYKEKKLVPSITNKSIVLHCDNCYANSS